MTTTISVKYKKMSPYTLYLDRVAEIYNRARAEASGLTFFPSQMGGLHGQREVLQDKLVMEEISFNNKGS